MGAALPLAAKAAAPATAALPRGPDGMAVLPRATVMKLFFLSRRPNFDQFRLLDMAPLT